MRQNVDQEHLDANICTLPACLATEVSTLDTSHVNDCLQQIYVEDEKSIDILADRLADLILEYSGRTPNIAGGWSQRDALLITYADTISSEGQKPIRSLKLFLDQRIGKQFSFVHLLPFFPWTSDDGFSITDFRSVEPSLGSWDDIRTLSVDYRLVFDAVINHVSASSIYMKGYRDGDPAYDEFFIRLDPGTDTSSVLRTRDLPLLHDYLTCRGSESLWTTFSSDQIDLNFRNPKVLYEILDVLLFYLDKGASMVRLDAIPYLWKELGTSCAHLPQTHALIKLIRRVYDQVSPNALLLTETNVPHRENVSYFGNRGDEAQMIYNFSLPPLILHAIIKGEAIKLSDWASCVQKVSDGATYLNITASHDGIGMRPTEGILEEAERAMLCDIARARGGQVTGKRNGDGSVTPYELNITYFDALNDPQGGEPLELQIQRFLLSQTIALSFIGIPGIFIHSLLGSRNYSDGVEVSGQARAINREKLDLRQLDNELADERSVRSRVFRRYSGAAPDTIQRTLLPPEQSAGGAINRPPDFRDQATMRGVRILRCSAPQREFDADLISDAQRLR